LSKIFQVFLDQVSEVSLIGLYSTEEKAEKIKEKYNMILNSSERNIYSCYTNSTEVDSVDIDVRSLKCTYYIIDNETFKHHIIKETKIYDEERYIDFEGKYSPSMEHITYSELSQQDYDNYGDVAVVKYYYFEEDLIDPLKFEAIQNDFNNIIELFEQYLKLNGVEELKSKVYIGKDDVELLLK